MRPLLFLFSVLLKAAFCLSAFAASVSSPPSSLVISVPLHKPEIVLEA